YQPPVGEVTLPIKKRKRQSANVLYPGHKVHRCRYRNLSVNVVSEFTFNRKHLPGFCRHNINFVGDGMPLYRLARRRLIAFVGKKFSDPPLEVEPFRPQFPECLLQRISCSVGIPMLSQAGECQFIKLPWRGTIVKTV